jgi:ferredoxin
MCPAVFKVGDDGKAKVQETDYTAHDTEIKEAIESCPVQAISEE